MVLTTGGWCSIDVVNCGSSNAYLCPGITDREASSAIVTKIDKVPIQTKMNPYTNPAGPPLDDISLLQFDWKLY